MPKPGRDHEPTPRSRPATLLLPRSDEHHFADPDQPECAARSHSRIPSETLELDEMQPQRLRWTARLLLGEAVGFSVAVRRV